jgi:iron complex transport system ATP-binding protein
MNAPMIGVEDLALRAGERDLVTGLSIQVAAGERWVVVGPNGSGKSTLLGALAGARRPQAGTIRIAGRPVDGCSVGELAALRALVNDRWLDPFSASVLETVLTARYRFGAEPGGRDAALAALSRMDCATALAQDAPVLLLDEPTSHQDPGHQAWVLDRLAAHNEQTVVAVLHDINAAARFATHVLLLSGAGWWRAGARRDVLTAPALSTLFGARIDVTTAGHTEVFWIGPDS